MKIIHNKRVNKGDFKIYFDNKVAGEMTYSKAGDDKIIIDHTSVSDDYRGQNVGKSLLDEAINFARENHFKIIPLCPFVKATFLKHQELQDVLS